MPSMTTKPTSWSCAALVCLAAAGCGIIKHTLAGELDEPLEAKLSALKDSGEASPLNELTNFDWDEVHLFNEYTPPRRDRGGRRIPGDRG